MMKQAEISGYDYTSANLSPIHDDLLLPIQRMVAQKLTDQRKQIFDLGCGNGAVANYFADQGFEVIGVDPSTQGVREGQKQYPHIKIYQGSAYDDLAAQYGQFPIVLSLEVVEHVYSPRDYAKTLYNLVEDGGIAVISTPYHGYWKNLALALSGQMDAHFTALWDHGHIKFWSPQTLTILLEEVGFHHIRFKRVGRIPALAKSMIAIAQK